jgi:hypothetical protein
VCTTRIRQTISLSAQRAFVKRHLLLFQGFQFGCVLVLQLSSGHVKSVTCRAWVRMAYLAQASAAPHMPLSSSSLLLISNAVRNVSTHRSNLMSFKPARCRCRCLLYMYMYVYIYIYCNIYISCHLCRRKLALAIPAAAADNDEGEISGGGGGESRAARRWVGNQPHFGLEV